MACKNTQPTTTTYCPNNLCDEVCVELISDKCVIHKGADIVCSSPVLLIKEGDKLDDILAKLVDSICTIGNSSGGGCACTIETIPQLPATLAAKAGVHGYHEFSSINNSYTLPSLNALQNKVFYITQMEGFRSNNELIGPLGTETFKLLSNSTVGPALGIDDVVSMTITSDGSKYIVLTQDDVVSSNVSANMFVHTVLPAGNFAYTLPDVTTVRGKIYYLSNNLTIGSKSVGSFDGIQEITEPEAASSSSQISIKQFHTFGLYSDGTKWIKVTDTDYYQDKIRIIDMAANSSPFTLPITTDVIGWTYYIFNNTGNPVTAKRGATTDFIVQNGGFSSSNILIPAHTTIGLYCSGIGAWYQITDAALPAAGNQISYVDFTPGYQLPDISTSNGKLIYVRNNSFSRVLLQHTGLTNIDNPYGQTNGVYLEPFQILGFVCNGVKWATIYIDRNVKNKYVNTTLATADLLILPPATTYIGEYFSVIKSNIPMLLTIQTFGSSNIIDIDNTNLTNVYLTGTHTRITLVSDGINWYIMSKQ